MSTLIDILQWRVSVHGSRPAFTFLVDGEPTDSLSFAQLDARARAIAASLQDRRCAGQPALLCHPPGLDYVAAFVGCLYAGALAIPLYPPRNRRHVGRIQAVVTNSGAPVVLTSTDHARDLAEWLGGEGQATRTAVVSTNDIETAAGERWRPIAPTPADLAYLQYTSGSTATPKGVMVSHENLLRNGDAIRDGFGYLPEGITVSWLPTFHDMGLLLTVVMPLLAGNPVYMMAPAAFVQRPVRWLDAIGRYRATHSGGPNFAFELAVDRITDAQLAQLDLSTWVSAYNGSEPVRSATMQRFSQKFARAGFSPRAHVPAYGLAEGTLLVSSQRPGGDIHSLVLQSDRLTRDRAVEVSSAGTRAIDVACCGPIVLDTRVEIVNPHTHRRCGPDEIGEIWSKGPGNALGYWQNEDATRQTFRATLADNGDGPFLRTGDLGILHRDELYITGRIKEVVILHGRNHYPHDIEFTLQDADPALERGAGAAFGVEADGEERLVIVQEVSRTALRTLDAAAVLARLREVVVSMHEVDIYDLVLVSPLEVPKTSSGKIQRGEAKARYLADAFKVVARQGARVPSAKVSSAEVPYASLPRAAIHQWLITRLSELRSIPPGQIDDRRPFESLGVDSLLAVQLSGELEEYLGMSLAPTLLYDHPSIGALAEHLAGIAGATDQAGLKPRHYVPSSRYLSRSGGALAPPKAPSPAISASEPIAIVGMGCRFPGRGQPGGVLEPAAIRNRRRQPIAVFLSGRLPLRRRDVRRRVLRDLAARGGGSRSTAAPRPGSGVARARGCRARARPGGGHAHRRLLRRHLARLRRHRVGRGRPNTGPVLRHRHAGHRCRRTALLCARPRRPEPGRRHRVLLVSGGRAPGGAKPARGRVPSRARWRCQRHPHPEADFVFCARADAARPRADARPSMRAPTATCAARAAAWWS